MSAFERCWQFLRAVEGGGRIVNDTGDPGGITRWGISQRAYPGEDIRTLTEERAKALFARDYWDRCRCESLPTALAIAVADTAFNQGPETAINLLQMALHVEVDGIIGRITLAAIRAADTGELVNEFLARRLFRYADGNIRFRHGWFRRVLLLKDALTE